MTDMTTNPFLRLYEAPVEALTAGAYALLLLAALFATWYALGRNLMTLYSDYQNGWYALPPAGYTARVVGALVILALDLLLIAAIIGVLTG